MQAFDEYNAQVKIADGIGLLIVVKPVEIFLDQRLKARDIRPSQTFIQELLQGAALTELKGKAILDILADHPAFVDVNFGPLITLGGETRKACKDLLMKDLLGLSESAVKAAVADEREFQMRITGSLPRSHAAKRRTKTNRDQCASQEAMHPRSVCEN